MNPLLDGKLPPKSLHHRRDRKWTWWSVIRCNRTREGSEKSPLGFKDSYRLGGNRLGTILEREGLEVHIPVPPPKSGRWHLTCADWNELGIWVWISRRVLWSDVVSAKTGRNPALPATCPHLTPCPWGTTLELLEQEDSICWRGRGFPGQTPRPLRGQPWLVHPLEGGGHATPSTS